MEKKSKQSICFFIAESLVILSITTLYYSLSDLHLSAFVFFVINLTLVVTVHGVTGFIFDFPYYKQYPEDTDLNILKNKIVRFAVMAILLAYAVWTIRLLLMGNDGDVYDFMLF